MGQVDVRHSVRGVIGIGVCAAVLATACTDGAKDEAASEAEVLGIQVQRDGDEVATVEPTEEPTAVATPEAPSPSPAEDEGAEDPVAAEDTTTTGTSGSPDTSSGSTTGDTATPAPPAPASSPSPGPATTTEPPVALTTREGHSYITWFRDEETDDQGGSTYVWSEVSAAPVVTRDGSEPLRVTLVDLAGDPDRSAPRRAQCPAWLEVDGDRAVRAAGTLTVEVMVDGGTVSSGVRTIDVTVRPGERRDLVAIGDVRVAVPDVAEVTCRVTFAQGATG